MSENRHLQHSHNQHGQGPVDLYLARLTTAAGRRVQLSALNVCARHLSDGAVDARGILWWNLGRADVLDLRDWLADHYRSPASANRVLCAVRGVLDEASLAGYLSADEYRRLTRFRPIPGSRIPQRFAITDRQVSGLLAAAAASPSPTGPRDFAIVATLYATGIRRSELVALDLEHLDLAERRLRVRGKGNKERIGSLTDDLVEALRPWFAVRGLEPGPLFLRHNRRRQLDSDRLTASAVYNLTHRLARRAGLDWTPSPHDFRRSFVTRHLLLGVDINVVRQLVGHSKLDTTAVYDVRPDTVLRDAATRSRIPFPLQLQEAEL
jgi:site-specific recombinase XerD